MPHQCVHCGKIYPIGSKELLEGCGECKSHFFFYLREDQVKKAQEKPIELEPAEKKQIEKDIREMAGIIDEKAPVVLDLESIRVTSPGKFEIDIVNLFNQKRPLIYKLEEGKYIIDLSSTLKAGIKGLSQIKDSKNKHS
jgi:predicted  nucleic acid-binding Zn-ribbon protein